MNYEEFNFSNNTFIGGWLLKNKNLCDTFIEFFKAYPNLHSPGHVQNSKGNELVDSKVKNSIDIPFNVKCDFPFWKEYIYENQNIVNEYKNKFPMCDFYAPWGIVDDTNLQYYPPGGGYKIWHTERTNSLYPQNSRHLVFMTYLNDVNDGGETEFFHQKLKIKPQKGLTIIWPADWTHTHKGLISNTEEKYILTGWYNFIN
jgi:hypothetical protein